MIWSIELLGRLRARQGDQVLSRFRTLKAAGILAYLAYSPRNHSREALIELFWPEAEFESGRHSLSMALSSLRTLLEPPGVPAGSVIVADRVSVELNPNAVTTDVATFEQALRLAGRAPDDERRSRHLLDAIDAYGGPLLPGSFEEWVLGERDRLAERFLDAVRQSVALLARAGETGRALDLARRAVAADPLREELHGELIRLLAGAGQVPAALRQYQELEHVLQQELEAVPTPALQRLARELESQAHGAGDAAFPIGAAPTPARIAARALPVGTVTFLLTDIEGSTARWEREGNRFSAALAIHHALLRRQFQRHGGHEVKEAGDSFVVAFEAAGDALAGAVACQRALAAAAWPEGIPPLKVRMALHAGDVELEDGEYRGQTLHRAARIVNAAHGGQTLCSEAAFALLRRDLDAGVRLRDLGLHRLRDVEESERLFQVDHPGAVDTGFPPLRVERAHRGNLPPQLTRFFGREAEIEQLTAMLVPPASGRVGESENGGVGERVELGSLGLPRPSTPVPPLPHSPPRLVTLSGPGGTGKTRLALEVAAGLLEPYAGSIWFVPLADLADPSLLPEAIVAALRLEPSPAAAPLDQVAAALGQAPSLLVLDNFEQLVSTAMAGLEEAAGAGAAVPPAGSPGANAALEAVRSLLEQVPALRLLVTSRQVLALPGEREFPVPPLPTPGDAHGPESLSMFESVRLFVDRAQAVRPDFHISNSNAPAVAQLCIGLEGIPLAIELAASRAQVLTPGQMLQQLNRGPRGRFDLLVTSRRGIVERQRALRATVDWSYRLLSEPLQGFFGRLSVFRGGWDVEAAEAIAGTDPPGSPASIPALDLLALLRDCSLVQTEESGEGIRFRMLDTLREYAAERLAAAAETEATRRRHVEHFLALAEQAEPALRGPSQAAWLERLEVEHDNFRAALDWAMRSAEQGGSPPASEGTWVAIALRLCKALWHFWSVRGHVAEGRRRLAAALAAAAEHPALGHSPARAGSLVAAGVLAHEQSDYEAALSLLEEGAALWRSLAAPDDADEAAGAELGRALNCLANLRLDQGQPELALPRYQEALARFRAVGDAAGTAIVLSNLGVLHLERGDTDVAAGMLTESIRLKRTLGNPYGLAMSLESLGNLERSRGDRDRARELGEEALAIRRELGHRLGIAMSLNNLGHLLLENGDPAAAAARLRESLEVFLELAEPRSVLEALTGLAGTAAATGRHETAVRLLGAMEAQREAQGFAPRPCEKAVIKRWRAAARNALEAARFDSLWQEGRALSLNAALQLALTGGDRPAARPDADVTSR